jgi:hypothetical protein
LKLKNVTSSVRTKAGTMREDGQLLQAGRVHGRFGRV